MSHIDFCQAHFELCWQLQMRKQHKEFAKRKFQNSVSDFKTKMLSIALILGHWTMLIACTIIDRDSVGGTEYVYMCRMGESVLIQYDLCPFHLEVSSLYGSNATTCAHLYP